MLLPYQGETIDHLMGFIDGVILPGGDEDIHPKFYEPEYAEDVVISFEILILKKSLEQNIPILGICRGMQLINVVLGGTLIKHIPDYIEAKKQPIIINHTQPHPNPKDIVSHAISIKPNTKLARMVNNKLGTMVNSTHHQAISKLVIILLYQQKQKTVL